MPVLFAGFFGSVFLDGAGFLAIRRPMLEVCSRRAGPQDLRAASGCGATASGSNLLHMPALQVARAQGPTLARLLGGNLSYFCGWLPDSTSEAPSVSAGSRCTRPPAMRLECRAIWLLHAHALRHVLYRATRLRARFFACLCRACMLAATFRNPGLGASAARSCGCDYWESEIVRRRLDSL